MENIHGNILILISKKQKENHDKQLISLSLLLNINFKELKFFKCIPFKFPIPTLCRIKPKWSDLKTKIWKENSLLASEPMCWYKAKSNYVKVLAFMYVCSDNTLCIFAWNLHLYYSSICSVSVQVNTEKNKCNLMKRSSSW